MSRVGARREREGTVPRATAVPRLAKPARHAGYAPGAHRSRAYLVCRAGFRRPRHAARAGHRAFHSRVRSRPEMYLGSASSSGGERRTRVLRSAAMQRTPPKLTFAERLYLPQVIGGIAVTTRHFARNLLLHVLHV